MKVFINAYNNGQPLGSSTIEFIKSIGFTGVRTDIPNELPRAQITAVVEELVDNDLEGIFIIGGWQWYRGGVIVENRTIAPIVDFVEQDAGYVVEALGSTTKDYYIEIGNEPNFAPEIYKKNPDVFGRMVKAISLSVALREFPKCVTFISGGVSNINPRDGLDYAKEVATTLHPGGLLGIHPYRMKKHPWEDLKGQSIGSIANSIRSIHPGYAITEGGWHTAPRSKKFPLSWMKENWSDQEVADFAVWELDFWKATGAELYTWYQINDGPDNEMEQRFGIRTVAGTMKKVAYTLRDWIKANAA